MGWLVFAWVVSVVGAFVVGYLFGREHRGNGPSGGNGNGEEEHEVQRRIAV